MATDQAAGRAGGEPGDQAVPPGLEHLQHLALDAVRAARAVLDAAEAALRDPATLETVIRTASGVARTATETVAGFAGGVVRPPGPAPAPPRGDGEGDDPDGGYHDIAVG